MKEPPSGEEINRLVEQYSDMLLKIAYTHLKNTEDAKDAVQSVFLRVLEKKPEFETEEHEKAWLIRVCINLCCNNLRSVWRRKTTDAVDGAYDFSSEECEVMSAVRSLPVRYRGIVYLFYYEDRSISEISSILGRKESTVGSQLYRARKMLETALKEDTDDG